MSNREGYLKHCNFKLTPLYNKDRGKKGFFYPQEHTVPCVLGFNSYSGKEIANTQLDTMANPHFKELELSHSYFICKDVV